MWFLIGIGYIIVSMFVARRVFVYMGQEFIADDTGDRVMNAVLGLMVGVLWPLGIPVALIMYKPKKSQAEIIADRDARIKDLEKELGIRNV